jgi:transglutaminase-like putative cysteine protease
MIRAVLTIKNAKQLWMPLPREWDGSTIKDVVVRQVFPEPTALNEDADGNQSLYWEVQDTGVREYGFVFEVSVRNLAYTIDNIDTLKPYDSFDALYQRYTQPSKWCQADAPEIIKTARKIVGDQSNPLQQARLIHQWDVENIAYTRGDTEGALTSLHIRKGECGGLSMLYVALLRALGIPARNNSGWFTPRKKEFITSSARQKSLSFHVWPEFYVPDHGWIQADTSISDDDFAHIQDHRIIMSKGDDIYLEPKFPRNPIPWFHLPYVIQFGSSASAIQNWGEDFRIEVVKVASSS